MNNELAYFTDTVNKLIEGKLILVDKNIAQVLKCVATVPALYGCLAETVRSTNYVTEFSRARVTWTRPDGTVEARLKMPTDRNRLFAFVVCLLTEVDSGRRNFLEFLKEYYNGTDTNVGYEAFVNDVLKPFKHAGETILHSVDPESLNMESINKAGRFFNVEKIYISGELASKLVQLTEKICNTFDLADGDIAFHKEEVLRACEYFSNALYLKNPKILAISWLALKGLMYQQHLCKEEIAEMENLMSKISL